MKGFSLYFSRRMGMGARSNRVASSLAIAGVACAVAVMIVTLAVSQGFRTQIRHKLEGFQPDIVVLPCYNYDNGSQEQWLEVTPELKNDITKVLNPGANISAAVRLPGILKTADDYCTLVFTAYDYNHDFKFEKSGVLSGIFPDYEHGGGNDSIVISKVTADRLGLKPGDKIDACFFINDDIKARRYMVAAVYSSNFGEYDNTICYASFPALQRLGGKDSVSVTSLEIRNVQPQQNIASLAENLQNFFITQMNLRQQEKLPVVDNIYHTGAMYINWLDMLDTNVVVIFALMCAVAGCTLISCLFILILNNVGTIGLLRSMGATKKDVRNIFVMLTLRLAGVGMVVGDIIAIAFICIQAKTRWLPLNPDMYYLDAVPVQFSIVGFLAINLGVAIAIWLILLLPARLASGLSPAKTLHYQ